MPIWGAYSIGTQSRWVLRMNPSTLSCFTYNTESFLIMHRGTLQNHCHIVYLNATSLTQSFNMSEECRSMCTSQWITHQEGTILTESQYGMQLLKARQKLTSRSQELESHIHSALQTKVFDLTLIDRLLQENQPISWPVTLMWHCKQMPNNSNKSLSWFWLELQIGSWVAVHFNKGTLKCPAFIDRSFLMHVTDTSIYSSKHFLLNVLCRQWTQR